MASTTIKTHRYTQKRLACSEAFFKCLETFSGDGYGVMSDAVAGAVYNPIQGNWGQWYDPETGDMPAYTPIADTVWMRNGVGTASNSVYPMNLQPVALQSGSWPNLAQKKVIIFGCGTVQVSAYMRIPFGNGGNIIPGSDGNVSVSCGGSFHGLVRGTNATLTDDSGITHPSVPATSLNGVLVALVGEYVPATAGGNGSFHYKIIRADGTIVMDATGLIPLEITEPVTIQADCTPHLNNLTRFGGLNFYGIRMFSFNNGLPPEAVREAAYKWMMRHYAAGHREEPPHFYGYD